mmetsp:Transcript_69608/g.123194  ORF Transcript_69608/g.123194 Transcript_69608/m.123194 type:complete len:277 (+) Transcript_69608:32-862(+)
MRILKVATPTVKMVRSLWPLGISLVISCGLAIDEHDRCKVGLTFSGLGPDLDGDYMANGPGAYVRHVGSGNLAEMNLGFTWTDPDHPQHTPYGCDFWTCSSDERKIAAGKWGIIGRTKMASERYKLLAVCEEGCPDFKPSCAEQFNQQNCTEGRAEDNCLHCPTWPNVWQSRMQWRSLISSLEGVLTKGQHNVTLEATCCKRKEQECDAANEDTCSGLIGLFHNNCPPNAGSLLHPQTKLQKDCCTVYRPPPLDLPGCGKAMVPTVCDHVRDLVVV